MEEILEQIEQKHYSKVKKMLADMLIPDVAELLERIEREAPHQLPEKAAAEADERLAADEAKAEAKQESRLTPCIRLQLMPPTLKP